MKAKFALVTGVATGYVLGTRAGRQQYEKIRSQATALWNDPKVQDKVSSATGVVKEQVPVVGGKLSAAGHKVTDKVSSSSSSSSAPSSSYDPPITPVTSSGPVPTTPVNDVIQAGGSGI